MDYLIKNGTIVNSSLGQSGRLDIHIRGSKIAEISEDISVERMPSGCEVINAEGLHIFPGLIDIHVHMREPGFEAKETFETGSKASLAGGFTAVAVMPNTSPAPDTLDNLNYILDRIESSSHVKTKVVGAISKSIAGEEIAEIDDMAKRGIVGISDDGRACMDMDILREAFIKAKEIGMPVICHCEDHAQTKGRSHLDFLNEYEYSIIERDLKLGLETGAHVHITHLSVKEGLDLVRKYRLLGCNATCDVTAHHIALNKEIIDKLDPLTKVNPPIRSREDMEAMVQGVLDGSIDAIASDHAPHEMSTKTGDIDKCAFGISGIEVSFPVTYTEMCVKRGMGLERLADMMSLRPAQIIGIDGGVLSEGAAADIAIIDLSREYEIDPGSFVSKGKNNPMKGYRAKGRIEYTFVDGKKAFQYKK
jgi:dihydroorotase